MAGLIWPGTLPGGLNTIAQSKGITYGAAVHNHFLQFDPVEADLVVKNCGMVVTESDLIPYRTMPSLGVFAYTTAQYCLDFATTNGMWMRGHSLIQPNQYNQAWLTAHLATNPNVSFMTGMITEIVGHFAGLLPHWNVANELMLSGADPTAFDPAFAWQTLTGGGGGLQVVKTAFETAHAADPTAKLFLSDFDCEFAVNWNEQRRRSIIWLATQLVTAGIPIHGVSLESHLWPFDITNAEQPLASEAVLESFYREISDLGLEISVSELDVTDSYWPYWNRDQKIADLTTEYLDVVLDNPKTKTLITWNMANRHSWLNLDTVGLRERPDHMPTHGLPYGESGQRTKMWYAIANCLVNAPPRP